MGNKSSTAIGEIRDEVQTTTARQDEAIATLRRDLENVQNDLAEDAMRGLQERIHQTHADITQEVDASIQQAVGSAETRLQQQNEESQAIIREEVKSTTIKQSDRMNAVEQNMHEMDKKLNVAKEERRKAEANMKRSFTEADKKIELFKIRMQNQLDSRHNAMEKKMKQQQELMEMQLKQQQEILDKQMKHTKECADKKLDLLHGLKEIKATSTPEQYDQALKVLTFETPVPQTYEGNHPPLCTDELERERNFDEGGPWFDVDSPRPTERNWTQTHTAPMKQLDYAL